MKRILALIGLVALLASTALAADRLTFEWTHSETAGVTGYNIYYYPLANPSSPVKLATVGYVTNVVITNTLPAGVWVTYCTSIGPDGLESDRSNYAYFTNRPAPPTLFRVVQQPFNTTSLELTNTYSKLLVQNSEDLETWRDWFSILSDPDVKSITVGVKPTDRLKFWRAVEQKF